MVKFQGFRNIFRPDCGAEAFFASIAIWGVGIGCFAAVLNNFLVDIHGMDELERGWLEFFRELPGLLLVVLLAGLHRVSDWKILRIGTICSAVSAGALLLPGHLVFVTLIIMLWSTGEHLIMPIRQGLTMQLARPGRGGQALGALTAAMNGGIVLGSILVAALFYLGVNGFGITEKVLLYDLVWVLILILMLISIAATFTPRAPNQPSHRPRLYFHRKFSKYYILELFYGARKQIFLTFAPFVLIINYHLNTTQIAFLFGLCAALNMLGAPLIGKLTDRIGYRNIMIYDTVVLFFVCILYGYAGSWFPPEVAVWVVCGNFILDMLITPTSLATNLYVRDVAANPDELTSTLSTGISINHLISILAAPLGGWVWQRYGVGTLFSFAAAMAVGNSLFALTLPKGK